MISKETNKFTRGIIYFLPLYFSSHSFCSHSQNSNLIKVPIKELRNQTYNALIRSGHSSSDANIITDNLLYAELRSNNQGIIKVITGGLDPNPKFNEIRRIIDTKSSSKFNGGNRIGMTVVAQGVDDAIVKAQNNGISIVSCSGYASATGALGYWTKKIAKKGLIGIVMSQCNEMVAPFGSYEAIFGTNPISIGIPTVPRPQILDMATSITAFYALKLAQQNNEKIPFNIAYDKDGNITTDPNEALNGALQVFDRGYKGSHLALMVELLAGALSGAAMEDKGNAKNWGTLIIAIDPSILGEKDEFLKNASIMCERVKNSKKLHNVKEIFLPGERGDQIEANNLKNEYILFPKDVFEKLKEYKSR